MTQLQTETSSPALRLTMVTILIAALVTALFVRLWFLQVLAGDRYAALAEQNRVRTVVTEAPRGRILDRDGEVLVKNRPALTVSGEVRTLLDDEGEPLDAEAAAVLDRLGALLQMSRDEIIARLTSRRYSPFRAVPIKEDVSPEVIFTIEEHQELYRGVKAETLPVRTYPHGLTAAHLIGYLGEITEAQLADDTYRDYRPGDLVGKGGLERTYERFLQGQEGFVRKEVNARGTVIREIDHTDPVAGADLRTSLDLELQLEVERLLQEGIIASRSVVREDGRPVTSVAGSAVVLDPTTGGIVAMASWPTYDPKEFVGGVTNEYWAWLNDPVNEYPLLNRAVQAAYPPGSTFKIVTGASALESGLITPSSTVNCPPAWRLADITFRNWSSRSEGRIDITHALMRSCDTFFYELAYQQWVREERAEDAEQQIDEAIGRMARQFGYGRELGVDLPAESAGIIPGREWKHEIWEALRDEYCARAETSPPGTYEQLLFADNCRYGGNWRGGDAVNMSIGQGDVLATPLQVAASYAAVANGGTLYRPHVGLEAVTSDGDVVETFEPQALETLPLAPEQLRAIQRGLERVVMEPRGTANVPFAGFPLDTIPVAGKTGTAEFGSRIPYAWFAAYAPADAPRYVVVVSVEEGSGGSVTAAPIARRILEAAFDLPVSPFVAGPPSD